MEDKPDFQNITKDRMDWDARREEIEDLFRGLRYTKADFFEVLIRQEQSMISKLEADKEELLEGYKELLIEAEIFYAHYPNNFRSTKEEYFKQKHQLIQKMENRN